MRIDPKAFATARLGAGLSERRVAELAGVTVPVVQAVEAGRSAQLTLEVAGRLADALGVSLAALLDDERPDLVAEQPDADDQSMVEALLLKAGRRVHQRFVQESLGWTADRARRVLVSLRSRESGGIEVYCQGPLWGLRPRLTQGSRKAMRELDRRLTNQDGLTVLDATVLFRVAQAERTGRRPHLEAEKFKVPVAKLINAGLLANDGKQLALGRAVRFGLQAISDFTRREAGGRA